MAAQRVPWELLALLAVVAVVAMQPQASNPIALAVTGAAAAVRGIRNNNPGNIRRGEQWQGMAAQQTDPEFVRFVSMEMGVRALVRVLRTYYRTHGLRTVRGIVNRYAPPNENNTGAYIAAVAAALRVDPDAPIDFGDDDALFALVRAIIRHEVGAAAALLVSDDTVRAGIRAAGP